MCPSFFNTPYHIGKSVKKIIGPAEMWRSDYKWLPRQWRFAEINKNIFYCKNKLTCLNRKYRTMFLEIIEDLMNLKWRKSITKILAKKRQKLNQGSGQIEYFLTVYGYCFLVLLPKLRQKRHIFGLFTSANFPIRFIVQYHSKRNYKKNIT